MRKSIIVKIAFSVILGALIAVVSSDFIWWGYAEAEPTNELCQTLVRKHYPFRHFLWSGIFPFYGGFIPDPHYLWSDMVELSGPTARQISATGRYQLVDVNPFFDDASSEVLLLVNSNGRPHEYHLDVPQSKGVQAVVAMPTFPNAILFPHKRQLAALVDLYGAVKTKGVYLLPVPLEPRTALPFHPVNSPEFAAVASEFPAVCSDPSIKIQFCVTSRMKPFIAYYEKYCGPCESRKGTDSNVDAAFAEYWLQ